MDRKKQAHLKARYARDQRNTSDCNSQGEEQRLEEHYWAQGHKTI